MNDFILKLHSNRSFYITNLILSYWKIMVTFYFLYKKGMIIIIFPSHLYSERDVV